MPDTVAARTLPPMLRATVAPASLLPVMVLPTSAALMMSSVATALISGGSAMVSTTMLRLVLAVAPVANVAVASMVSPPCPMAVMSASTSV